MAVPVMASVQGKLKAKYSFNPDEYVGSAKTAAFISWYSNITEYFDEFIIGYMLTDEYAT